jgi:hypothetical protein
VERCLTETGELCRFPPENRTQKRILLNRNLPFLPAELQWLVGSVMPATDEVLRGMCEFVILSHAFLCEWSREVLHGGEAYQ